MRGPLAVAALACVLPLAFFDRGMFLLDEGHILMFADIVANGGELYRDANLLPLPGAFYLLAAAFEIFGPSILVARWLILLAFAGLVVCAFLVLRRLAGERAAWLGVALLFVYRIFAYPHWQLYSYSTLALALLALALLLFVRFLESESRRALAGAGLAAGLAISCKQDYGGAVFLALGGVLVLFQRTAEASRRPALLPLLGWYVAPAALVGLAIALHFLRQGLFGEMFQQTVWNHLFGIATFEYTGLPDFLPLFTQDPALRTPAGIAAYAPSIVWLADWDRIGASALFREAFAYDLAVKLFFYAPYAIVALGAIRFLRRRRTLSDPASRVAAHQELALFALATALVLALNKPVDYLHVFVLLWPLPCLLVVWGVGAPRALAIACLALLVPVLLYTGHLAWTLRTLNTAPLRTDRAGILVGPEEERVVGGLAEWIAENSEPDQEVAVLPYFTLVSYLADRRAPHRAIYTFWPIAYIEDREREIIAAIERSEADVAAYHFTQALVFPRMDEFAPDLFAYLVKRWEIAKVFSDEGWGYMMAGLRRSGPPEGAAIPGLDAAIRRGTGASRALWPFRPVVALRPGVGAASVLTLPVDVPENARLRTAVGVHPREWFRFPPSWVRYEIRAVSDGAREVLARVRLDPHRKHHDRRWHELDLDLDAYAGRRIELELAAETERESGAIPEMAGFEEPRLVRTSGGS